LIMQCSKEILEKCVFLSEYLFSFTFGAKFAGQ